VYAPAERSEKLLLFLLYPCLLCGLELRLLSATGKDLARETVDLHIRGLLFESRRRRVVACIGILLNPGGSPLVGTLNNGNVAT
jgi:hypothetical protein